MQNRVTITYTLRLRLIGLAMKATPASPPPSQWKASRRTHERFSHRSYDRSKNSQAAASSGFVDWTLHWHAARNGHVRRASGGKSPFLARQSRAREKRSILRAFRYLHAHPSCALFESPDSNVHGGDDWMGDVRHRLRHRGDVLSKSFSDFAHSLPGFH